MKIGLRLMISFFAVAMIATGIIGFMSYEKGQESLEAESFNRLTAVREMKATQIESYFRLIRDQLITFSEDKMIISASVNFISGFNTITNESRTDKRAIEKINQGLTHYYNREYLPRLNKNLLKKVTIKEESSTNLSTRILQNQYIYKNQNPVGSKHKLNAATDSSSYSKAHRIYHPVIRDYLETFGYYDIFIVDASNGNIVYSVFKEVDYATSLTEGPYSKTNLARVFNAVVKADKKDAVRVVDFEPYHPSYNAPAAFMASPVYNGEKMIAVLVFQMPIEKINDIMTSNHKWKEVGLGASGETYIVGSDFTLRNQSRFLIEDRKNYLKMIEEIGTPKEIVDQIENYNSAIGLQEVKTEGTEKALKGETGAEIFNDYRGVAVLSAYKPLNIPGMHWVIMSEIDEAEAFAAIYSLRNMVLLGLLIVIGIISIISFIMAKRLTSPIKELSYDAMQLAKGNMDVEINIRRKDEIGVLALSFKKMQVSIKNLIGELKEINHGLEEKVIERTKEIHHQKEMVEEKNKEILDSINYAERLQKAILPPIKNVKALVPNSFILFKPKDIVSGDFYWMDGRSNNLLLAAVDCTGHGVPGAMVSVVGANGLNRCVREYGLKKTGPILDKLRELILETFETSDHEVKDGMDISLCHLHVERAKNEKSETVLLEWSGANNPLWILRKEKNEIEEIKADKQPIGKHDQPTPFTTHEFELRTGDTFYLFTDGYADQFGGPRGKKFKYKTLQDLLISMRTESMEKQQEILNKEFELWRGELEQVDDVCIIGVRV
jgi:serine phosphatase RsbU (regulator of sigma subunit)